jgi:hypothetical protein
MISQITEENRTIFIGGGISANGDNSAEVAFDRYDKVTYTKEEDGTLSKMDGTPYTKSSLPNGNSITSANFIHTADNYVLFNLQNEAYASATASLTIVNNAGLNITSVEITTDQSGSSGTSGVSVAFDANIPLGTVIDVYGYLYNKAYEPTPIEYSFTKTIITSVMGYNVNYYASLGAESSYFYLSNNSTIPSDVYFFIDDNTGYTYVGNYGSYDFITDGWYFANDSNNILTGDVKIAIQFTNGYITGIESADTSAANFNLLGGFGNTIWPESSICTYYNDPSGSGLANNTTFFINLNDGYTTINGTSTEVPPAYPESYGWYLLYDTTNLFSYGTDVWVGVKFGSSIIADVADPSVVCAPPSYSKGNMLALDAGDASSYSGSGASWNDISGNSNTVTLNGGYGYSSADGGYITFDGSSAYGEATHNSSLDATTGFSIEFWVNYVAGDYIVASKAPWTGGPASQNGNYMTWLGDPYHLFISNDTSGNVNYYANYNATPNTWQQLVFTFDGTTGAFYKNGSAVSFSIPAGPSPLTATDENLLIGKRKDGYGLLNGKLSVLNLWNRAITSSEVSTNFDHYKSRYGL